METSALCSAAVFFVIWIIATFINRYIGGLSVGSATETKFVFWPLFVPGGTFIALFIVGMIVYRNFGNGKSDGSGDCESEKDEKVGSGKIDLSMLVIKVKSGDVLNICIVAALILLLIMTSLMLGLFGDYVIIRLFGVSKSKWLILAALFIEAVIVLVIERKKLRVLLPRTILPLLPADILLYVLLVAATSETIEAISFIFGSFLLVMLPLTEIAVIVKRRIKLKESKQITQTDYNSQ